MDMTISSCNEIELNRNVMFFVSIVCKRSFFLNKIKFKKIKK